MDKDRLVRVTLAVWRVTELFPQKCSLKEQIRKSANEILADLILASQIREIINLKREGELIPNLLKKIEILFQRFELAKAQNWVNPRNFLVLKTEYSKIKKELEEFEKQKLDFPSQPSTTPQRSTLHESPFCQKTINSRPFNLLESPLFSRSNTSKKPEVNPSKSEKQRPGFPSRRLSTMPKQSTSPQYSSKPFSLSRSLESSIPKKPQKVNPSKIEEYRMDIQRAERQRTNIQYPEDFTNRKKEILKLIQKKEELKLGQLLQHFPKLHRRTLIRDLEDLSQAGLIKKVGNRRAACYKKVTT